MFNKIELDLQPLIFASGLSVSCDIYAVWNIQLQGFNGFSV